MIKFLISLQAFTLPVKIWTISKDIFNYSRYYLYLTFKMAKPSVFIALYIHDLVIHYILKYQLLLNTCGLLLQAFDFAWAIMVVVSWCCLAAKLPPIHLLIHLSAQWDGAENEDCTLCPPQCSCWGHGVRNSFIGVWAQLCSHWQTGLLPPVFWSRI